MNEQSIFSEALDIEDDCLRAAYLDQACGSDAALRKRIESLLGDQDQSGAFLSVPALEQMKRGTTVTNALDNETTSPDEQHPATENEFSFLQPTSVPGSLGTLGHYDIQELIGSGGFGSVFRAFDQRLHRLVAVKVLMPNMAVTLTAKKRFLREARATAAIRHENVVHIYAVEDTPVPFLVMEFIDGKTLQQVIDETGPLDLPAIRGFGQKIAEGLEAAHQKGLIHRDLTPGNILIESGTGQVKVVDFGLVRVADDASESQSLVIAGTPPYMSPEQAQGTTLDHRSDLFSLGSVLYLMCSGRSPFRAPSALAELRRVVEDKPRNVQEIIPEIPAWLVAIIEKLLEKDPAQRFASAQEVADLLAHPQTVLSSSTSTASDRSTSLSRGKRVYQFWLKTAAMVMLLLLSLGVTEATGITNVRGTVVRFFSPAGTLVVEVDDPAVSLATDGEQLVITGAGANEVRVKPGKNRPTIGQNGKTRPQELVTITRDGRQVVRVSQDQPKLDEGFTPLFNGANLDGWMAKRSASIDWRNEEGTITGRNRSARLNSAGHLQSIQEYGDFHFRCEVLAGSGVEPFLLFRNDDNLSPGGRRGYALIAPVPGSTIIDEGWGYGSLYADDFQVPPERTRLVPSRLPDLGIRTGDWYRLEFIANQEQIEVRINGIATASYSSEDPRLNKAGRICIRCGAGGTVTLRRVEVKDLSKKVEVPPPQEKLP